MHAVPKSTTFDNLERTVTPFGAHQVHENVFELLGHLALRGLLAKARLSRYETACICTKSSKHGKVS